MRTRGVLGAVAEPRAIESRQKLSFAELWPHDLLLIWALHFQGMWSIRVGLGYSGAGGMGVFLPGPDQQHLSMFTCQMQPNPSNQS